MQVTVAVALCQCFSPSGIQTETPGPRPPWWQGGLDQRSQPSVNLRAAPAAEAPFSLGAAGVVSVVASVVAVVVAVAASVVAVAASVVAVVAAVVAVAAAVVFVVAAAAGAPAAAAAAAGRASSAAAAAVAAVVFSGVAGVAASAGTVAVAAPGRVVVLDKWPRGRDGLLVPRGMSPARGLVCAFPGNMSVKAGSSDKNRACALEVAMFESGRVCVSQGRVFHCCRHGNLSASHRLGPDGACYKISGHNADPHGDCANRDISGKKFAHIEGAVDTRCSTSARTSGMF